MPTFDGLAVAEPLVLPMFSGLCLDIQGTVNVYPWLPVSLDDLFCKALLRYSTIASRLVAYIMLLPHPHLFVTLSSTIAARSL
jgi:hypothetical protein